jgi:MFS family permease
MGANALAGTYALLFVGRIGVGAVEANGPAAVSLLSDYYPVRDRARVMGLYQSGALVGAIVGLVVGGVAVGLGGWRWAFAMWIPFGIAGALFLARQPEPVRGDQDAAFHDELGAPVDTVDLATMPLVLPPPRREGTLDYQRCTSRDVGRELLRIPSMWFGVLALTVSQLLLNALQFWGVEYYKRVHHLGAAAAGAVTALFGLGAVVGLLAGGVLADRLLARGIVNARVHVVAYASIAATLVLAPAFASTALVVTVPLMLVGGILLTLPVAPAEALVSDVVVAELRGRAATVRSAVRALSAVGPLIVGVLADAVGLRWALVALTPVYAVGGVIMLGAARHYPADVAFVVAESRRVRAGQTEALVEP